MSNWYIGQHCVAIRNHSSGKIRKGQVYTIRSLMASKCRCVDVYIDVGFSNGAPLGECQPCGVMFNCNGIHWFAERLFAPIEEGDISELLEVLKTEKHEL